MAQALDRPNVGMRGKLFEGYAPQFLCLFSLMLTHFLIAAHFTSRTIQDLLPLKFFGEVMVLGTLPVLALILLWAIKITVRQIDKPTITLVRLVYSNRSWILRSLLLFAIMLPTAQAFVALKVAIPSIVPFYADPYLAALDRMLFLGIDPWRFTHAIFGLPATVVIDWVYASWGGVATAVMLWAAFDRDPQFQIKAAFSLFLTWAVLGNALAIALSSVGPIFYYDFYGATTFAPLMEMLPESLILHDARNFLLESLGRGNFGSGISAAPSLHVAVTCLLFLMVRTKFRNRWVTSFAATYLVLIFIGSIHLAWHYALDGIISLFAVPLIWRYAVRSQAQTSASDQIQAVR